MGLLFPKIFCYLKIFQSVPVAGGVEPAIVTGICGQLWKLGGEICWTGGGRWGRGVIWGKAPSLLTACAEHVPKQLDSRDEGSRYDGKRRMAPEHQ